MNKDWFKKVCDSYYNSSIEHNGIRLPGFPSEQVQINTTGWAGEDTLKEGYIFYEDCISEFNRLNRPLTCKNTILDFGVGWGRISRFFLKEVGLENLFGLDVTGEMIDICRETFRTQNFVLSSPYPPSSFEDGKFDFIVGYSVFSHLSEDACLEWMREFYRITTPGAILALTTRGRPFFDYCESLSRIDVTGYQRALSKMFLNFDDARKKYDDGNFVFSNAEGVTGNGVMTPDFYGEAFIPQKYAANAYKKYFELKNFMYDELRQSHPIMFFQRVD